MLQFPICRTRGFWWAGCLWKNSIVVVCLNTSQQHWNPQFSFLRYCACASACASSSLISSKAPYPPAICVLESAITLNATALQPFENFTTATSLERLQNLCILAC
jgi:hypothetical protein